MKSILVPLLALATGFCLVFRVDSAFATTVETAELQFAICNATPKQIEKRLNAKVVSREDRSVYYLESDQRDLQARGIVIRYRASSKGIKSSVKRNFELMGKLPSEVEHSNVATCEVDAYLKRSKIGCTVKAQDLDLGALTDDQQSFLEMAGAGPTILSSTHLFGPVQNRSESLKFENDVYSLDIISLPDGSELTEISLRVPLTRANLEQARILNLVQRAKLDLCPSQTGVTKKILDHYLGPVDI